MRKTASVFGKIALLTGMMMGVVAPVVAAEKIVLDDTPKFGTAINGKIFNADDTPATDVRIYIVGLTGVNFPDRQGCFRIEPAPVGRLTIAVARNSEPTEIVGTLETSARYGLRIYLKPDKK